MNTLLVFLCTALGASSFKARESSQTLITFTTAFGYDTREVLHKYLDDKDPEVRMRARNAFEYACLCAAYRSLGEGQLPLPMHFATSQCPAEGDPFLIQLSKNFDLLYLNGSNDLTFVRRDPEEENAVVRLFVIDLARRMRTPQQLREVVNAAKKKDDQYKRGGEGDPTPW